MGNKYTVILLDGDQNAVCVGMLNSWDAATELADQLEKHPKLIEYYAPSRKFYHGEITVVASMVKPLANSIEVDTALERRLADDIECETCSTNTRR